MEELFTLRQHIEQHRYDEALLLLGEMDEMSREDKLNKIGSFAMILLLHLIKQAAEKRTTRSWDISIRNATWEIARINKRRKAGGYYLDDAELRETLEDVFPIAVANASLEAFEGQCSEDELRKMIDRQDILRKAMALIAAHHSMNSQAGSKTFNVLETANV